MRSGLTGYEDTELIVSGADLLANDMLGGVAGTNLSLTGIANFSNGKGWLDDNGFAHFTPTTNFYGTAGFDYTLKAPGGQTATANVTITVKGVNDAPTVTVSQDADEHAGSLIVTHRVLCLKAYELHELALVHFYREPAANDPEYRAAA